MPIVATKDVTAYVSGRVYEVKKGESLDEKPKQLQAALVSAGVAETKTNKVKE